MATKRVWAWTGRLAALLAAIIIPACGSTGSPGGANPNGILWNSQGTPAGGGAPGAPATGLWVNPNSGLGAATIGISNIITSADDATYSVYTPTGNSGLGGRQVVYIAQNSHPLSTDTGSQSITSRENGLQGQINGYRQQQLGNVGAGGANGGGVAVGNVTGIILSGHFKGTKSARAHCKHYALGEQNFPLPPGTNVEGDNMQLTTGGPAFRNPIPIGYPISTNDGRLGKIQVIAYDPAFTLLNKPTIIDGGSIVYMGVQYGETQAVFSRLLIDVPGVISAIGWTNFAVGHWRGGRVEAYFWNIIFLLNPADENTLQQ